MLDIRWLREHPDEAAERLASRGRPVPLQEVLELDREHRALLTELEARRAAHNRLSQEINRRVKAGAPAGDLPHRAREVAETLAALEPRLREVEARLRDLLLALPNLPHPDVPAGTDQTANRIVRASGEQVRLPWARPHWEIAQALDLLDPPRATAIAGSRFPLLKGEGARLQRALSHFMLDLAIGRGFTEIAPPLLATGEALLATGHLPKFEDGLFQTREGLSLIPTAEVPLVNLHRDEVLEGETLPRRYAALTPCFRKEAGAPGRETRGLIRVHQFEKVELVSFTRPEDSGAELERLVVAAEAVASALRLPYRVVELCAGELGFTARRTYDLEVWCPGLGRYLEVSSCSDCGDFQARRCATRYRDGSGRPRFVHTLNASALAVGRTLAALLENGLQEDGSVVLPPALRPYLGGKDRIARER